MMRRIITLGCCKGRDRKGATAIEFALIAPVLFLIMIGTVESCLAMFAQHLLESAAFSASRLGKTGFTAVGQTQQETMMAELFRRVSPVLDTGRIAVSTSAYQDYTRIAQPEPYIDANGNGKRDNGENFTDINGNGNWDSDQGASGLGQSQEVVVYTVTYPWPIFTPMMRQLLANEAGNIVLTARIVVRNEPYAS